MSSTSNPSGGASASAAAPPMTPQQQHAHTLARMAVAKDQLQYNMRNVQRMREMWDENGRGRALQPVAKTWYITKQCMLRIVQKEAAGVPVTMSDVKIAYMNARGNEQYARPHQAQQCVLTGYYPNSTGCDKISAFMKPRLSRVVRATTTQP